MAFETIIPAPKIKHGVLKVSSIAMRKGGVFKLQISMPHTFFTQHFGKAENLTVQIGTGTDRGKLLILPAVDGAFKPSFMKHTVIVRMPELAWSPQFAISSDEPETGKGPNGGVVIVLPEWAYDEERQKAVQKAREQVARERAAGR